MEMLRTHRFFRGLSGAESLERKWTRFRLEACSPESKIRILATKRDIGCFLSWCYYNYSNKLSHGRVELCFRVNDCHAGGGGIYDIGYRLFCFQTWFWFTLNTSLRLLREYRLPASKFRVGLGSKSYQIDGYDMSRAVFYYIALVDWSHFA